MVQPIKGRLARAVRERRGNDTEYLDKLRNRELSFNNMKDILELIDEAKDEKSLFYEDIVSNKRNPEEVIETLQALYDEKSSEGFGAYYSLPYGDGRTIGDKTTGNPVKWVEENIQELYDEILKGNPIAFLSGMAILISRVSVNTGGRQRTLDRLKELFSKIQTDDERWQSVNKEQLEGAIEGNEITQGYNIVKRLNALHVQDKEYATINLGTWLRSSNYDEESFTNIMKIYGHMLNRTTSNFTGPLVDFFKGGNFEVKTSLLRRLLRARGPTALETLFSNYLIFRFSRGGKAGSAVGGGDLISRKNVTDWVKTGGDTKYPALTLVGDETREELLERIRLEVKQEGATKTQFNQWKNDIVPQVEGLPKGFSRRMGRNKSKLEKNEYVLMLSVYHRFLLNKDEEGNFTDIPKTYNFALLDENPENSFKMKAEQFKNAIALALSFNPISIEEIENVFNTLKGLEEEEPRDYFRIVAENAPALEAQIKSGVDDLFTPIPAIIINELTEVLSTINPNRVESLKNFIKIKNKNPYEYLHEIDALYDENLEQDPDYYKR
jgi:hypothetical protein